MTKPTLRHPPGRRNRSPSRRPRNPVDQVMRRLTHADGDHAQLHLGTHSARSRSPRLRAVVDLRAVINIENVHDAAVLVDSVNDAIGAAPGAVTTRKRPEQRLAYPLRVHRERGITELEYRSGNGLRESLGDRSPCGRLEPNLVPLRRIGGHAPVARRRARSWRTVAMSAPGSPLPKAARLSEIRATASPSPRISRVISRPSRSSTESRTASASPLRVSVIRSCCWRTRRTSSDRRALASESGTGVAAMLMVRSIDPPSQPLDQPRHR